MGGNSRVLTKRMSFKGRVNAYESKQLLLSLRYALQ